MAEIRASSPAAVASWRPSVPRNGHRGPPSVQPQATHYVLLVGSVSGRLLSRRALGVIARAALAAAMAWRCCRFSMATGPSTSDILNFANVDFLASDACLRRSSKFGILRLLIG